MRHFAPAGIGRDGDVGRAVPPTVGLGGQQPGAGAIGLDVEVQATHAGARLGGNQEPGGPEAVDQAILNRAK